MSRPTRRQVGGSIRKVDTRSGPRWRFTVDLGPDPDTGRRRQRQYTFKTEAEAVDAQAKTRVQVVQHVYVDRTRVTVNGYLDDWLTAGERHWRPSTHRSYQVALGPVRDAIGDKRLQRVERADVERIAATMLHTGGRDGNGPAHRAPSRCCSPSWARR